MLLASMSKTTSHLWSRKNVCENIDKGNPQVCEEIKKKRLLHKAAFRYLQVAS